MFFADVDLYYGISYYCTA